jgi:hypothetical protein
MVEMYFIGMSSLVGAAGKLFAIPQEHKDPYGPKNLPDSEVMLIRVRLDASIASVKSGSGN